MRDVNPTLETLNGMNGELNETCSEEGTGADPSPDCDEEMAAAMRYFQKRTGWRVADLARAAELSPKAIHRIMMGHPTDTATLHRVCRAIGVAPWMFWLIGSFQFYKADPARARLSQTLPADREAYGLIIAGVERLLSALAVDRP